MRLLQQSGFALPTFYEETISLLTNVGEVKPFLHKEVNKRVWLERKCGLKWIKEELKNCYNLKKKKTLVRKGFRRKLMQIKI